MNKQILDINLLPVIKKKRKGTAALIVILSIMIAAVYVFLFVDFLLSKQSINKLSTSEQSLQEEIQLIEGSVKQNDQNLLEDSVRYIDGKQICSSIPLKNVNETLPKNSQLISYRFNEQEIRLQLHFQQMEEVSYYAKALREFSYITEVKTHRILLTNAEDKGGQYWAEMTLLLNEKELRGAMNKDE